jgi:hypothetical protein
MKELNYLIVSPQIVWQWYFDSHRGKHFKELSGKEADDFIKLLGSGQEIYIEDILPAVSSTNPV